MKTHLCNTLLTLSAMAFLFSCAPKEETQSPDDLKAEIAKAEQEFEAAAKNQGIVEAFYSFADENAVIKRGDDSLIFGNENIKAFYEKPVYKDAEVSWSPDFIDVSEDGTMGYTYGKYVWAIKDSTGLTTEYKGVFHTVWKKQADGSWKYVWD